MIHRLILALSLAVCLMSVLGITQQSEAASTYTITIPSTLDIHESGWHELSGGITASGSLDNGKQLVITASSDNGFKFVKSGDNTQTVSYDFRASSTDTTPITSWTFASLSTDPTTQTAGINVEDYSEKPGGTYTETVTFTAEIVAGIVDLSTLTGDYEAEDGVTLTGKLGSGGYKITVAAGATVTLDSVDITGTNNNSCNWAGITCEGNATIILSGDNNVKGFYQNYPGIHIAQNYTLTIKGDGSLTASSNGFGAGIGGGAAIACGNIVIQGGTITATGGEYAAGIGGGNAASCGTITITTGVTKVTATAGGGTWNSTKHSIGAGDEASCGTVTIGCTLDADGNPVGGTTGQITATTYTYITSKTGAVTLTNGTTLAGTGGSNTHITVAAGATITLDSVDITSIGNNNSHNWAGITCVGNATIILSGDNKVKGGFENYPGIHIASGDTLTIKGDGSLTASSGGSAERGYGAGIGGGIKIACGNIVIQGGTVTAIGGCYHAAGIGVGYQASCGTITISGGTITATGGDHAAGIGGGYQASCGTITISGGTITATGGDNAAGIGSGYSASCGNITITTGVTKVTATAGGGTWEKTKHSIGASDGKNAGCGTVTIGGTKGQITTSPYTYEPGK